MPDRRRDSRGRLTCQQPGSQLAAVAVDRVTADWLGDAVVGDGMAGMRLAVDHLLD